MSTTTPNPAEQPYGGGILVEFIDPPHEVTEEERNRPRYGRPVRKANTDPNTPTNNDTPTDTQTPPPAES